MAYQQIPMRSEEEKFRIEEVDGVQYRNKIPIGRPINMRRDNDSSFASEYPTL